ncbi:hydroxymethylbilane synthase [Paenactinomyces guangxiensis]|uniref:Porphobilinogen deaminase n=1 Tax=Paenactinomyces guangxiensis TaxID=1490290 RepID=A0A7W1WUI2_9BACL|nr:hydroxymethylbilane synthase [Paenactinomyces guangxiensis]MBA4496296.1 hydroxymethylbilane synthase [Paenactinomyces guangxiensis]MBH8593349.1 hydroxymethylbilane synthase [Paenactinomyces guangxiensis]
MRPLVVGTRKSELALTQTNWVVNRLQEVCPGLDVSLEKIVTKGDRILNVTLSKVGGKGLFVKEIEQALLDGRIDFAVHSMKDMPAVMPKGLVIGAIPVRENPHDCLISRDGSTLSDLPSGAVVGTSSLRRQAQILACRPDLTVEPVRGNLGTRISKMKNGQFDAIILAAAGLSRMDWQEKINQELSFDQMLPAVGQGALAIQCREDDRELLEALQKINHEETARAVRAERAFLQSFQGGCHLPLAGYAAVTGERVRLTGLVAQPDGKKIIKATMEGQDEWALGKQLANKLADEGAAELLATVREGLVG